MITGIKSVRAIYLLALTSIGLFTACNKDVSSTDTLSSTGASASAAVIAVAASEKTTAVASTDSVYVMQPCPRGTQRVSITEANLPAGITSYLVTNYAGYIFSKAFAVNNSSGATSAY